MPIDVEQLKPDTRVRFPGRAEPVTLVAVRPGPFYDFFFLGPNGPDRLTLAEEEIARIELVEERALAALEALEGLDPQITEAIAGFGDDRDRYRRARGVAVGADR